MKALLIVVSVLLCGGVSQATPKSKAGHANRRSPAPRPRRAMTDDEIINNLYSPTDYAKVGRVVGRNYSLCCKRYGSGVSAQVYCHYCN